MGDKKPDEGAPGMPGVVSCTVSATSVLDVTYMLADALATQVSADSHLTRADLMMALLFFYYLLLANESLGSADAKETERVLEAFRPFAQAMSLTAVTYMQKPVGGVQ